MIWTRDDFVAIIHSDFAKKLFMDSRIHLFLGNWRDEHKAAVLHANGITAESDFADAQSKLQLLAAFNQKDVHRIAELVNVGVTVGVRLDYLLPLYDSLNRSGEDVFVAAVKVLLKGSYNNDVKLSPGQMMHKVGESIDTNYNVIELQFLENYVNSSFKIREILASAPNKTTVQPTKHAVEYILANANSYVDTNNNPVIVFIPGAINIDGYSTSDLISRTIENKANVNDVGLFGVSGIVWSIILGDYAAVKTFLNYNAKLNIEDEFGNKTVMAWASATAQAQVAQDYINRLTMIFNLLQLNSPNVDEVKENLFGCSALDYFKQDQQQLVLARTNRRFMLDVRNMEVQSDSVLQEKNDAISTTTKLKQ